MVVPLSTYTHMHTHTHAHTHIHIHTCTQVEAKPDTGEPTDVLITHARRTIEQLGSPCTKVSEIIETKDSAVFKAIQDGLDRANKHAISNAQVVNL